MACLVFSISESRYRARFSSENAGIADLQVRLTHDQCTKVLWPVLSVPAQREVHGQLEDSCSYRVFNVIDDYNKKARALRPICRCPLSDVSEPWIRS